MKGWVEVSPEWIVTVRERLERGEAIRQRLLGPGRLHLDRRLPFLCLYRRPLEGSDQGTPELITGEASYLIYPGTPAFRRSLLSLLQAIGASLVQEFGAFLLLEVWTAPGEIEGRAEEKEEAKERGENRPVTPGGVTSWVKKTKETEKREGGSLEFCSGEGVGGAPRFCVFAERRKEWSGFAGVLVSNLKQVRLRRQEAQVSLEEGGRLSPPDLSVLTGPKTGLPQAFWLGVQVDPVYRDPNGVLYPGLLRQLRREISRAFKRTFYEFSLRYTSHTPASYHALGRRVMVRAVWEADRQLASLQSSFDFLLQVTPINVEAAWRRFQRKNFDQSPPFEYRPLVVDPVLVKRQLFQIRLERLEDPTIEPLFREKQRELDRKLTMLQPAPLRPRFLEEEGPSARLASLRQRTDLLQLLP